MEFEHTFSEFESLNTIHIFLTPGIKGFRMEHGTKRVQSVKTDNLVKPEKREIS
jgi:hypothetical protein